MKLTPEQRTSQARILARDKDELQAVKATIWTMIGGGRLAEFAVRQPADFYIDIRVGRLPYSRRDILQAVAILAEAYEIAQTPLKERTSPVLLNLGCF